MGSLCHRCKEIPVVDAEKLEVNVSRIDEGSEKVHNSSNTELSSNNCNVLHRTVIERGKEEGEPRLLQELLCFIGLQIDGDTEPLIEIGTP
jgi:hypothetical protein